MSHTHATCCARLPLAQGLRHHLSVPSGIAEPAHYGLRPVRRDRADLIVLAHISTGVPGSSPAEAMAVSGGVITAIGTAADVAHLAGPDTTLIKPDGFISPGLIEPHAHIFTSIISIDWTDVSHQSCATFDDVVATLKKAAEGLTEGEWLLGQQFDPSLYPGEPDLTRDILDQAIPNTPVFVMNASMHFGYFNSAAMQAAGITDETPDPPHGALPRVNGRLTGIASESGAELLFISKLPQPTPADISERIYRLLSTAASRGVTSFREATTGAIAGVGEYALLHQLNGAKRLPTRVSTAQWALLNGLAPEAAAAAWAQAGVTPFSGDGMVRADAWKVVTDGSNQGRTGYQTQPYLGEQTGGQANYTPELLRAYLSAGLDAGWQLMIHANGDGAVEFTVEALEDILPGHPHADLRHRLEHCSLTTDDQLARMASLGLSPSFLMNHVYYWGAAFRDTILGPARADTLDRVASALTHGLRPSLHSDYNVSEIHPLFSAQTAVQRIMQANGEVLNPHECATPEQALTAITVDAAWQIHADDRGTLEVGKRADWAVLSADPWSTDPAGWHEITVSETRIDGEVAYQA